jgi:uncharacterized protein (TIGR02145 family)
LYNWSAALTACAEGSHLPNDEEWKILEASLLMKTSKVAIIGWQHSGDVGEKLKSTNGWNDDGNGDNSSGFSAFPNGYRRNIGGGFYRLGWRASFWTSSSYVSIARRRSLRNDFDWVYPYYRSLRNGYLVRFVKDEGWHQNVPFAGNVLDPV